MQLFQEENVCGTDWRLEMPLRAQMGAAAAATGLMAATGDPADGSSSESVGQWPTESRTRSAYDRRRRCSDDRNGLVAVLGEPRGRRWWKTGVSQAIAILLGRAITTVTFSHAKGQTNWHRVL